MNNNSIERGKPTVEPIATEDKLQKLNEIVNSKKYTRFQKDKMIRQNGGGYCSSCGAIATKIARYKIEGASLIEKYCEECLSKI